MSSQPNFVFFITDQHRADHIGAYGNRQVSTPHIDALAASGWLAERCYAASPVCMPNRATLLTGRWPRAHGVRNNGIPLSLRARTFVDQLREAGYRTALVGKGHLQNMTGRPRVWPPEGQALAHEAWADEPGRYDQEWAPAWRDSDDHDLALPYYGFDDVDLVIDHGDQPGGHYARWLRREHPQALQLSGPNNALPTPDFELSRIGQAWRTRLPEELHPTSWIGERSVARLRRYAAERKPFFLQCSFADPHHPFTPPERYWDMFDPRDIELPHSFHSWERSASRPLEWMHRQRLEGKAVRHTQIMFAAGEREVREAIALNYALIAFVDSVVGRVLRTLDELELTRDTVVMFTSDHGDLMGDHGLLLKGPLHYQGVTRVPWIWRDPQAAVENRVPRSAELLSSADIAPTILERASVQPFNGIQGRSAMGLMRGDPQAVAGWRDGVFIEEEAQRPLFSHSEKIRVKTMNTRRFRITLYDGDDGGELYDLAADPHETRNVWSEDAYAGVRSELLERMVRREFTLTETSPYPSAIA